MTVSFLDLHAQYVKIKPEIDQAISEVISGSAFVSGKYAEKFEEEFGAWLGGGHCIGCGNGTDALEIALEALDLGAGAEVIVPTNSFIATSEAVSRVGLKVRFADVDEASYLITAKSIAKSITPNTKAVIVVHLYGNPVEMGPIMQLAKENNLTVVEDCAQSHGAKVSNLTTGLIGDVGCFSFYPGKNLGAFGDAGAIVTQNDELAERVRKIGNHGRTSKYSHEFEGRNSRLDGMQAAVLSVKLQHLNNYLEIRRATAKLYNKLLSDVGDLILPVETPNGRHVYHLYVIRTQKRDALRAHLQDADIATGVHYPVPLHKLKAYEHMGISDEQLPIASSLSSTLLSLPIGDHMNEKSTIEVIDEVKQFFKSEL